MITQKAAKYWSKITNKAIQYIFFNHIMDSRSQRKKIKHNKQAILQEKTQNQMNKNNRKPKLLKTPIFTTAKQ